MCVPSRRAEHVADVARADEPGPAGHQEAAELAISHVPPSVRRPLDRRCQPAGGVVVAGQFGCPQERGHRAGVRPVPVVDAAEQPAVGHVVVEDVGDLELAAAGRREVLDDLERIRAAGSTPRSG